MATLAELQAKITTLDGKVDALQAAIDADQSSDAAVVVQLTEAKAAADAEVARLQAIIDSGAVVTPADLEAAITNIEAIGFKVDTASNDVSSTN